MVERIQRNPLVLVAMLLTVGNLLVVWAFRFLPLFDYPIWLYEVRIMRALSEPMFSNRYELAAAPVPNLGFVGPVWMLSFFFPLEVCGKIVISLCVAAFPWAVRHCVKAMSGGAESPAAYIGFPYAFNIYFFGANGFLVGLILALIVLASFVPRVNQMSNRQFVVLSLLLLLVYFAHLMAFALLTMALAGAMLAQEASRRNLRLFLLALVPSVVCLAWYAFSVPPEGEKIGGWSLWGLAQNIFKPIFLFVKSYAIPNTLPLTALNLMWLFVLAAFLWRLVTESRKRMIDRRFVVAACLALIATVGMPKIFFGVYEAGVRFGLPALLFVILMFSRGRTARHWAAVFVFAAFCVMLYNAVHFKKVDAQMQALYRDLVSHVELRGKSFRPVRFDYPPPRDAWDIAAASVDPLFGAVYYAGLESGGGEAWIFGSALLKKRRGRQHLEVQENSKDDLARQLLSDPANLPCDVVVLVGNHPAIEQHLKQYRGPYHLGKNWTILMRSVQR